LTAPRSKSRRSRKRGAVEAWRNPTDRTRPPHVFAATGDPDDVRLGEEEEGSIMSSDKQSGQGGDQPPSQRILGVPYGTKRPTPESLKHAVWKQDDDRVFPPKRLGVGWGLNLRALARKLGLGH
jgi:hypothetical protein